MGSKRWYLSTPRGQVARVTFDPKGMGGISRTGRLVLAFPCGVYRSCAAGWRIMRAELAIQSLRGYGILLPRVSLKLERW